MNNKQVSTEKKIKALNVKNIFRYVFIFIFSFVISILAKALNIGVSNFWIEVTKINSIYQIMSLTIISTVLLSALLFYISQTRKEMLENKKIFRVIFSSIVLTFIASFLFGRLISIYLMPLALSGLLIAILIDKRIALIANIFINIAFFFCFMVLYDSQDVISYSAAMLSNIISGTYMILMMEKTYTRMRFLVSGAFIAILIVPLAMFSAGIHTAATVPDILFTGLWSFLAVLLSVSLFITLLPAFEKFYRLTTNFGLEEICSFDAKLLKKLSIEAPGTFNHSLGVGNLAQLCALAIGENPQLAKAAAYYHDVGKLRDPQCYVENQKGYNPHDDFIPEVSVFMITSHTKWGYDMIKKHNLPDVVADIAREHHGTTPVNYFYNKVKKITEEDVEQKDFCYDGPIPSTRIAAIIMIADTVEAATRAQGITNDETAIRTFVHGLIESKRSLGQFSNCNLTFRQLQKIEDTLVDILPGIFHNRISYESNTAMKENNAKIN